MDIIAITLYKCVPPVGTRVPIYKCIWKKCQSCQFPCVHSKTANVVYFNQNILIHHYIWYKSVPLCWNVVLVLMCVYDTNDVYLVMSIKHIFRRNNHFWIVLWTKLNNNFLKVVTKILKRSSHNKGLVYVTVVGLLIQ